MVKAHTPINWENEPSHNTPINETNLNKMDKTIGVLDDRIIEQETSKLDKSTAYTMVKDISFNENNGVFTVTRLNGSTFTIDTRLEKIAINFKYDYSTQKLIVTLIDGTTQSIDMSALVTQYEFADSATLDFTTDSNGKVTATIKSGSITEDMLQPNYLAEIKVETAKSAQSMANAKISENNAKQSELNAKASEEKALEYSNNAQPLAQSVSGTNPTATNSTDGNVIYLKNSGYTEQKKLVFDGSVTATTSGIKNTNPIPCKKGDSISVTAGVETRQIIISTVSGESRLYPGVVVPGYYLEFTLDIDTGGGIYIEIYKKNDTPKFEEVTVNGSAYATPSPDNPIRIGGLDDKGYFDGVLLQGSYNDEGIILSNSVAVSSKNHIECTEGDVIALTYEEVITRSNDGVYPFYIRFYDIDKNFISRVNSDNSTNNIVVTAPTNAKSFLFTMAQDTSITPSTAKHICVTINGQYAVRVKTCGKNLYDESTYPMTSGTYINKNNGNSVSYSTFKCTLDYMPIESYVGERVVLNNSPGGNSPGLAFYDANKVYISGATSTAVVPDNAKYIRFSTLNDATDIQLEVGTVATPYEPHQETTALIPITSPLYEGDYIEVFADGSGQIVRKMGSVVFDGTEAWELATGTTHNFFITYSLSAFSVNNNVAKFSHFSRKNIAVASSDYGFMLLNQEGNTQLRLRNTDAFTTVGELKSFLSENKPIFVGELKTPTTTPLTAEQVAEFMKLRTYKGVTHVTADGEVVMRYYCDNASGETVSMLQVMVDDITNSISSINNMQYGVIVKSTDLRRFVPVGAGSDKGLLIKSHSQNGPFSFVMVKNDTNATDVLDFYLCNSNKQAISSGMFFAIVRSQQDSTPTVYHVNCSSGYMSIPKSFTEGGAGMNIWVTLIPMNDYEVVDWN